MRRTHESGSSRSEMKKKVLIALDVDGTLRCNCTPVCKDPNEDIIRLAKILAGFKNVRLMVWSGGGKDYAQKFIDLYSLPAFAASKIDPTTWVSGKPQIAIDDEETFNLADVNLIIKEK